MYGTKTKVLWNQSNVRRREIFVRHFELLIQNMADFITENLVNAPNLFPTQIH